MPCALPVAALVVADVVPTARLPDTPNSALTNAPLPPKAAAPNGDEADGEDTCPSEEDPDGEVNGGT